MKFKETKLKIKLWLAEMKVSTSNEKFLMWYVGPALLLLASSPFLYGLAEILKIFFK